MYDPSLPLGAFLVLCGLIVAFVVVYLAGEHYGIFDRDGVRRRRRKGKR